MTLFTPATPESTPPGTVVDRVRQSARLSPQAEAVVCDGARLSWAQFDARVNRVANMLRGLGVQTGDKVSVLASTSVEYVEIFMGTLRAGACLVPLSTMASTEALGKMVADSGAKVLLLSQSMRTLADPFVGQLDGLVPGGLIAIDFTAEGWNDYTALTANAADDDPKIAVSFDDPFNIIYSSGTTGTPKGILHNHMMRAVQMARVAENGYSASTRTLLSTPLYSNTTITALLPTLVAGGTVVLMKKFNAREFLHLVETERCTHTMLVPVQYKRIMEVPDFDNFDLTSMVAKFSTSAPLRADIKRDVLDRFPGGLTEYYGLTEGGGVTVLRAHEAPDKLATVGQPAPGVELRFIDDNGIEVGAGKTGEICGRSPAMMSGYYNREDLTADMLWNDAEGRTFFRSGDMGFMDDDGFVHLSDRKKDMIISGGLNIYANDLELVLLKHPALDDVAVIGVPSDQWGESPLGLVVRSKTSTETEQDVLAWANERLGKSQRLAAIEFRDHLPRSSIGKILKRELRAPFWADQT